MFNTAIDGVLKNNPKARATPKALVRVQAAAGEFTIGESSAVRDGEGQ
jgi:hypothetical protein